MKVGSKRRLWAVLRRTRAAILLALVPGLIGAGLIRWPPAEGLERAGLDLLFQLSGGRPSPKDVCVVAIDTDSYDAFGLEYTIRIGTRGAGFLGDAETWDRAERMLIDVADRYMAGRYKVEQGEGAFYGPKADILMQDALGREWQLGTIQLDYNAPERFVLTYVGEDNAEHRPVVIHRAMAGSFERFLAILIEHFAGAFPVWIAPEQVRVIPISDAQTDAARRVAARLEAVGIRVHVDDRSETLNYRIREGEVAKVPYMAVVGQREAESDSLALRVRGAGKKQEVMPVDAFVARVTEEVRSRALNPPRAPPCPPGCRRCAEGWCRSSSARFRCRSR